MSHLLFPILSVMSDGKFHSGQEMAKHFNVSRVAIWHALAGAEKLGVDVIEAGFAAASPGDYEAI